MCKQSVKRKKLRMPENKGLAEITKAGRRAVVAIRCSQDLSPGSGGTARTQRMQEAQGTTALPKCLLRAYCEPPTALGAEQAKVEHFINLPKLLRQYFLTTIPATKVRVTHFTDEKTKTERY